MIAKPEHEITYQTLAALLKKSADEHQLTKLEVLAVAANMIGKLIALQDQRVTTPEAAMNVVARNIEIGNGQALHELNSTGGTKQ